jgi:4-diphosphocytidyl-2C-methyl-D-erythritol kinase
MLSGSGSAVFGLFADDAAADAAVGAFAGRDGWRTWRTSTW